MNHDEGTKDAKGDVERVSYDTIGAAIEVHRRLGPGLLELAYEACLARELIYRGLDVERQVPLSLMYRGAPVDCGYRLDLVINSLLIVEVKSLAQVLPIHRAQMLTYLRLRKVNLGLLLNFNVEVLRQGIHRIINS